MPKHARIAVIGTGWWASDTHIPALLAHPEAQLVALCDTDAGRLEAVADRYKVTATYQDVTKLLSQEVLDGVVVVTSNASHYSVAKSCLEHGLAVMVEKPMTLHASEAKQLLVLASQQDCELIVGYPFNFTPLARHLKTVLAELGPIQYVNGVYSSFMTPFFRGDFPYDYRIHEPLQYQKPEQLGGGHAQVQLTHLLGLLFFLTDLKPLQISAMMAAHQFEIDLVDALLLSCEGGALATLGGSGNQHSLTFQLMISCERGWVTIDAAKHQATIHRNEAEAECFQSDPEGLLGHSTAQHLVDVILNKASNISAASIGLAAVEVLEAAYRSVAQAGRVIKVKELYENS